jgi:hypothetical protein
MSDVTTGSAFNPQFFMNPPWWIGRVEKKEVWKDNFRPTTFDGMPEIQGWSHRYKIRVFNWHTGDIDKLKPEETIFAQVVLPVTAGSGHGGASISPSIESGTIVFGFFMDGMSGQEPYIVGLIGNSNNNVPKERAAAAPNQSSTSLNPAGGGTTKSNPPTPPTGSGSAANQPVPPNVDQLSTDQLKKLLDPSKTPSSSVFKAASEAREKAKAAGLPANEVERLVLAATVKASRQPGAEPGKGNCNVGYQQFNDTYTDGSEQTAAKVPDNLIINNTPLSITESLHVYTKAWTDQDKDSKIKVALLDVCKKGNSEMKGIQRTMKNLTNTIEELKKVYNQASALGSQVGEFTSQIQNAITGAVSELTGYSKNIMQGVRGYVYTKLSDGVKKVSPYLFPSEIPNLYEKVEKGMSKVNCVFNKIVSNMPGLFDGLLNKLLDKMVNTPLCAAENLMSGFIDKIMGQILGTLDDIFKPINAALSSILGSVTGGLGGLLGSIGALGGVGKITGNLFNALEFVPGILQFFSCEDPQDCVQYSEISQDRPALPGGDAAPTPSAGNESPTGKGAVQSQAPFGNVVNNTGDLDASFSSPISQAERDAVSRGEILGGGTITSGGNIREQISSPNETNKTNGFTTK